MFNPDNHVINSEGGLLKDAGTGALSSRADVKRIVSLALAKDSKPHLIIHFHGGLVNRNDAYEIAEKLYPTYEGSANYPIFFAWESGFFDAIRNNFKDIANDKLFQQLVKKISRWVLKQLPAGTGLRGDGGRVDTTTLEKEFDEYFQGVRKTLPSAFEQTIGPALKLRSVQEPKDELTLATEVQLELDSDFTFKGEMEAIHNSISPADVAAPTPKETGIGATVNNRTEISPEQVQEVFDITPNARGIFSLAKSAIFIAKVVWAVIRRYRSGRDHGPYTTIVEEILAAAYVDKIGGLIWNQMKKDTADAFVDPLNSAGSVLLAEISAQQRASGKNFSRITLVGHSTGAIYINNLIASSVSHLPNVKFDVVFLAPAITYSQFSELLSAHASRINKFRRFCMKDSFEKDDVLVPVIYIQSLLYFVSGLLEFTSGSSPVRVADTPLVGMERYRKNAGTFTKEDFPEIHAVEEFISQHPNGSVWSVTDGNAIKGMTSESEKHGDFDSDDATKKSLAYIANSGF